MNAPATHRPLRGRVAVVAGGTRGGGRGIAVELGAAGATVYVTGRSVRGRPSPSQRPETIDETAELVDAAGGDGIPVQVDHTDPEDVAALFARVAEAHDGMLDILVNDVWGGDALTQWDTAFWEHDLAGGLLMQQRGVHSHLVTSYHAAPLLLARPGGVVVEVTDGVDDRYRGNLFYDLAKTATARLAFGMAEDLRDHGTAAVAVTPGFMRSEAVLEHFGITEEEWRTVDNVAWQEAGGRFSESPRYLGRAVAALAADERVLEKSGGVYSSGWLAREYGFTDIDGTQPDMQAALDSLFTAGSWPPERPAQ